MIPGQTRGDSRPEVYSNFDGERPPVYPERVPQVSDDARLVPFGDDCRSELFSSFAGESLPDYSQLGFDESYQYDRGSDDNGQSDAVACAATDALKESYWDSRHERTSTMPLRMAIRGIRHTGHPDTESIYDDVDRRVGAQGTEPASTQDVAPSVLSMVGTGSWYVLTNAAWLATATPNGAWSAADDVLPSWWQSRTDARDKHLIPVRLPGQSIAWADPQSRPDLFSADGTLFWASSK